MQPRLARYKTQIYTAFLTFKNLSISHMRNNLSSVSSLYLFTFMLIEEELTLLKLLFVLYTVNVPRIPVVRRISRYRIFYPVLVSTVYQI